MFMEEKGGCIFDCLHSGGCDGDGGGGGGVVFLISSSCVRSLPHKQ